MRTHLVSHLFRRGVQHLARRQQYPDQLLQDAQAYEDAGPEMEVQPRELLLILFTALIGILIVCSIDYTIGQVMSTLAMIETSSTTTVIESKTAPPPYTESDEKELLLADAEPSDLEITVIEHKPITAKIHTTIGHLQKVGGFFARWRGMLISIIYNVLHGIFTSTLTELLGFGLIGSAGTYIFASVLLARMHMAWTHAMITYPDSKRCFRYVPGVKDVRPLLLPAFVYAAAEQVTIILPLAVAFALNLIGPQAEAQRQAVLDSGCPRAMMLLALRYFAVPATYTVVGLAILFPASVTLTRIEASLLPEGEDTIVPFDKASVMGDIDMSARGAYRRLFAQAWRSFDRASRWRLVKLYTKMAFAQFVVMLVTFHLIIFQLYLLGAERMAIFFKSASAQIKMQAMDAQQLAEPVDWEWTMVDFNGDADFDPANLQDEPIPPEAIPEAIGSPAHVIEY